MKQPNKNNQAVQTTQAQGLRLRQATINEVVSLAVLKLKGKDKNRVVVYLPPTVLPPVKALRKTEVDTVFGRVSLFVKPSPQAGWLITVNFLDVEGFKMSELVGQK